MSSDSAQRALCNSLGRTAVSAISRSASLVGAQHRSAWQAMSSCRKPSSLVMAGCGLALGFFDNAMDRLAAGSLTVLWRLHRRRLR